jgi:RNA polymerase sigma-70 factor, ECF subfamily
MTVSDVERLASQAGECDVALQMDEDAFRAFYDRTAPGLWAYLVRVTGDDHLADDLLQEAYYRFLRAAASCETEAHRRNYLFRIATNLVRDGRRRARVTPVRLTDEETLARLPIGGDTAGRAERRADLSRAMSRLKPRERAMLWLAYAQGATHREIADVLGLRSGSVKLLLFRARRKLAGLLGVGRANERRAGS